MRRIISIFVVIATICSAFCLNSYALNDDKNAVHYYEDSNCTAVEYYLDENGNPYTMLENEKVYLALPLENLKVIDSDIIIKLNTDLFGGNSKSLPTNYYDISGGSGANSPTYTKSVSFVNSNSSTTQVLKLNTGHAAMCFKAENIVKQHIFAGKKVGVTYYYYNIVDDDWYSINIGTVNFSSTPTYRFQHLPSASWFGKFTLNKVSAIKTFDFVCWTTAIW